MGTMSASDAAPLPRLGEVFFDVRSAARSLRISWYADTGVAVLSIWQGGTCTGSFRLPMTDLPRMIETLQRGPDGLAGSADLARSGGQDQAPPARSAQAGQRGSFGQFGSPGQFGSSGVAGGPDPAGSRSSHYLADALPAAHLDQPTTWYPGSGAAAGYPAGAAAAEYPDEQAAPHYQGPVTAAGQQEWLAPARHATQPGQPEHPEHGGQPPYPGEPGEAPYRQQPSRPGGAHHLVRPSDPAGPGRQNSVPESAGLYPGDSVTGDYSPPLPGIGNLPADVLPPAGPRAPGRSGDQPEDHWNTGSSRRAGDGLEPLPESFPYGLRLPDHELR